MKKARITGVGKYLPPQVITNKDIEALMNTSDEWIQQRSGIKERRWAEPGMSSASMGIEAARAALINAKKTPEDVDAIIFATVSPDFFFPGNGVLVQKALMPDRPIPALDIRNQCSGFIYSLSVADAWIRTGMYKCILLIGAELQSNALDKSPDGRDIGVLFGDGAGAVILEPSTSESGILTTKLHSEGAYYDKLWMHRPSSADFPRMQKGPMEIDETFFPHMEGRTVFKHAITRMCETIHEVCEDQKIGIKDIDFVLAHQANLRINSMVLEQLGVPPEKTLNTLPLYGNTTAATIPIGLNDALEQDLIKPGMLVAMVGFGSGFAWGATLLRW